MSFTNTHARHNGQILAEDSLPKTGPIDAAIALDRPLAELDAPRLVDRLDALGVAAAIVLGGAPENGAAFTRWIGKCPSRLRPVPLLSAETVEPLHLVRPWIDAGCQALSLASLGQARSPCHPIDVDAIESVRVWEAASETGAAVFVRPSTNDAQLLPPLAHRFTDVRVIVRGGLVSDLWPVRARKFPTPDRFTFDRLHQLDNVYLALAPSHAQRWWDPRCPPSGWHRPGNLLALFGPDRVLWGSETQLGVDPNVYSGVADPIHEFDQLTLDIATALHRTTASKIFWRLANGA